MLHRQAPCGRYRLLGRTAATQLGEEELVLLGLEALKVAQEPG